MKENESRGIKNFENLKNKQAKKEDIENMQEKRKNEKIGLKWKVS